MHNPILLLAFVTIATASSLPSKDQHPLGSDLNERYLIELNPGETRWILEDDKWALRRDGVNFMDITETQDLGQVAATRLSPRATVTYPEKPFYNETLAPAMKSLSKKNMRKHLVKFTTFYTRYYKSPYGAESSAWLLDQVNTTINDSGAAKHGAFVKAFSHPWGQNSVIATIPGKSSKTVIVGAHQDSINLFLPSILAAPGADDDGSGTVTILEALRVLLQFDTIVHGNASNTIEFHFYSAEVCRFLHVVTSVILTHSLGRGITGKSSHFLLIRKGRPRCQSNAAARHDRICPQDDRSW